MKIESIFPGNKKKPEIYSFVPADTTDNEDAIRLVSKSKETEIDSCLRVDNTDKDVGIHLVSVSK